MSGVNKVILLGRLGNDPDLKYTPAGAAVTKFSLATSESYTKDGQKFEQTEWHRITIWGKNAENCAKYLSKGALVYLEGKLKTDSWENKEGVKQYSTGIVSDYVQFIDSGKPRQDGSQAASTQAPATQNSQPQASRAAPAPATNLDEIPF